MRRLIAILVLLAAGGYYLFFYTPRLLEMDTVRALEEFGEAIATGDRAKVAQALDARLDAQARVHLSVEWLSLTQRGRQPVMQDLDRENFLRFVDNVLYSLEAYAYAPQLEVFRLNKEHNEADVVFTSKEWGDGKSYYGGISVMMRFSSDTRCEGKVVFEQKRAKLREAHCSMQLRAVPKPEEAYKIQQNPEAMQQFLMR